MEVADATLGDAPVTNPGGMAAVSIDEVNPTSTSRLTISDTGEGTDYQFGVDGTITGTGSREDHDWVFDDRATAG